MDVKKNTRKEEVDILIQGGMVLTMDPAQGPDKKGVRADSLCPEKGLVAIKGGRIVALGDKKTLQTCFVAREVIDATGSLVMPGLINTHTHAAMSCFRGMADDLPLKEWWEDRIFPAEARYVNQDLVYWGTLLACMEMIKSGTTTFCDGYFFEEAAARAVRKIGMRAILGQGIVDFPTPDGKNPALNILKAQKYIEIWQDDPLITPSIFCHSPYTCSPETLQKAKKVTERFDVPYLIHVSETKTETENVKIKYGTTPVMHLEELKILDESVVAVHAIWVTEEEISLLGTRKVKVSHCPESAMKLASGVAPIPALLSSGVSVGLGTDSCASNNDLDLFREMDTAAKLHKVFGNDPTLLPAREVVEMATIAGARVLFPEREVGLLAPGKKADIIIIDMRKPHLTPLYHIYSHLVYAAQGSDVSTAIVNGKILMRERKILTVDEEEVKEEIKRISRKIGRKLSCR